VKKALEEITHDDFLVLLEQAERRGWVSAPVCATHDGVPHSEDEESEWEGGFDPCAPIVRLWDVGTGGTSPLR
jgi:hypothetical protein